MNRHIPPLALPLLPALAAFVVLQACGGSDRAFAEDATVDPLEGVWESMITTHDCGTSAPTGTFFGAQMFNPGGTMSDTNASPTATRGPGFGTWMRTAAGYTVKFRFFAYGSTGVVSGITRVTRTVTLGATAGTATSVDSNQLYDLNGALVRTVCATDVSTKIL